MYLTCPGLCSLWSRPQGQTPTWCESGRSAGVIHNHGSQKTWWIRTLFSGFQYKSKIRRNLLPRSGRTCYLSAQNQQEAASTCCMVQLQSSSPQDNTNWATGHLTERTKPTGSHEIQRTLPRFRRSPSVFLFLSWKLGKYSGNTSAYPLSSSLSKPCKLL